MKNQTELLRSLPKVDEAINKLQEEQIAKVAKNLLLKAVRKCIDTERDNILKGESKSVPSEEDWNERFKKTIADITRSNLRRVINGSGVVIHTNLGRSLLASDAVEQIRNCSKGYSNLEFNLEKGVRGSRYALVEELLCDLTGAEAALVVNNNAAAVLLVLDTLAKGKETIVSRGELVEIGGSFRIPEIMEKSGTTLVEVGATNRTHLRDYQNAVTERTALFLKVHTSNFRMVGFTAEVPADQLVALAREKNIKVMEDLGSGCFIDLSQFGLPKEKTVQEVVASEVDVVTFSGDKLLGGPQAGIILGKEDVISRVKKNQLNRALRIDKLTLASLESTLRWYYDTESAIQNIPTLAMLAEREDSIKKRAKILYDTLRADKDLQCEIAIVPTVSRTGGGAMPEYGLDSWAIQIVAETLSVNQIEHDLRTGDIPVIGRIEQDAYILDMRTVMDGDVSDLSNLLLRYFTEKTV